MRLLGRGDLVDEVGGAGKHLSTRTLTQTDLRLIVVKKIQAINTPHIRERLPTIGNRVNDAMRFMFHRVLT